MIRREKILAATDDAVRAVLASDVQAALIAGDITVSEIAGRFELTLWTELGFEELT